MHDIGAIKDRINIHELISRYVELERRYSGYAHYKNPITGTSGSFTVYDDGRFRNEVTGDRGDVIDMICHIENMSFKDALRKLASEAGVEPSQDYKQRAKKLKTAPRNPAPQTQTLNVSMLRPFTSRQADAIPYLSGRRAISATPVLANNSVGVEYRPHTYRLASGEVWQFEQRRIILPNKCGDVLWGWQSRRDEVWIEQRWRAMTVQQRQLARRVFMDYVEQKNARRAEREEMGYVVGEELTPDTLGTEKKKDLIFGIRFMRKGSTGVFGLDNIPTKVEAGVISVQNAPYVIINEAAVDAMSWQSIGLPGIALKQSRAYDLKSLLADVPIRYIVMEPDAGGAGFVNWVMNSLDGPEWRNKVIRMEGTGFKDPNEAHVAGDLDLIAEEYGLEVTQ